MSDRINLVVPASPNELYRKGWPGSEIQMYCGCPWWRNHYRSNI